MIKNFRELAKNVKNKNGLVIKEHMIFRSGELSQLDDIEKSSLKNYGIKKIYDLRSHREVLERVTKVDIDVVNYNVTESNSNVQMDKDFLENIAENGAEQFMIALYKNYLPYSSTLKLLFQDIIKQNKPFLFHCSAGKDRTGIVGALVMYILDFDLSDIYDEFTLLDSRILPDVEVNLKRTHHFSDDMIEKLKPLNIVKSIYIESFFNTIKTEYHDIKSYIEKHLELSDKDIRLFKNTFLTHSNESNADVK